MVLTIPSRQRARKAARPGHPPAAPLPRHQAPLGRFPQALRPGRLTEELVCVKQRSDEGRIYGREEGDKRRPAMKGTRSIWFRALHSAVTLALAGVLAVGVGQIPTAGAATLSGQITAVEAKTALVTARAIGSGRTVQVKTGDARAGRLLIPRH